VQYHLIKVYRLLALTIILSIIGTWLQIIYGLMTIYIFPYLLTSFLIIIALGLIDRSKKLLRICLILTFGVMQGIIIGPLINMAIEIDANIVRSAFLLTFIVFASFSFLAMTTQKRMYLLIGSILSSLLFFMLFLSLFPSQFGYHVSLFGGLILFPCYVYYDTQVIIARVENGGIEKADYVDDTLSLYIDFVAIFVRILIIILRNRSRKEGDHNNYLKLNGKSVVKSEL